MRIEDGQIVLPPQQSQQIILGRGVMAELQVVQLSEELRKLKAELGAIREELEALQNPGSETAAEAANTGP